MARQPWRAKRKGAREDDKREEGREAVDKRSPPRNRLWDHVLRIKSLFIPTLYFAFAHRSLFFGRHKPQPQPQQHPQPQQQTSFSKRRGRRVPDKEKQQHADKYFDQVILSDCLDYVQSLPPDILHCTITCPPKNTRAIVNDDSVAWLEYVNKQLALLKQLYRVTKPGGHVWYVHKVQHYKNDVFHPVSWLLKSPWIIRQEIVWDKVNTPDTSSEKFWPTDERIFWLHKDPGSRFQLDPMAFKWGNIWLSRSSDHHSFPLYLALAILHAQKLSKGSLIFDPYGRSGTTAKACQLLKHHFLLTETDESKIKAIHNRLNQTTPEDKKCKSFVSKQIAQQALNLKSVPDLSLPE